MSTTSQLQFAIGTTDTTCLLVTANIMPSNSGVVTIDSEQIHYTVAGPNFLYGLTRGFNSTSAATHAALATVTLTSTDDPIGTGDLIGTAPVVVTGGTQTLAGSNATISLTSTGTGSVVRATSPTLVTPILGTPTSGVATHITGLPLTTGVTGVLPVANGGTNGSTALTNGLVIVSSSGSIVEGTTTTAALTAMGTFLGSLASDPGSPTEGQIWYNTTSHVLKFYNGTVTKTVTTN